MKHSASLSTGRFRAFIKTSHSRIVILFCMAATFALSSPIATLAQTGLGIAAVVNDDVISMLDLDSRISMVIESSKMQNTPETRGRIAHQVLRGLIDEKLKLQETRRLGIKVSQQNIQQGLQHIAGNNKMTIPELTNHLMRIGVPITALTTRLESDLAWQNFVNRRLARRIKVGGEEVKDEIARIQSNAGKPEYQLAEIYLSVDTPSQDTEVRTMAERLVMQMQQGTPFSALARNFSRAPSAAVGGDLGWVQFANLEDSLQAAVSKLRPGTASRPVRSLGGYYIMFLRNVRTSPGIGGGDALLKLSQYHVPIQNPGDKAAVRAIAEQMSAATRHMTSCQELEAAGAQTGSLMSGALGEMKLSTLPANLQGVLRNLAAGQPSTPVPTGGGLAVMMICDRTDEGVDMEKVKEDIRAKLVQSRLDVAAQRKLRDLRRDAFVDIRL